MSFAFPPLSAVPAYFMGTALVGIGLNSFRAPAQAYELFGIPASGSPPLPSSEQKVHPAAAATSSDRISPFIYAKAVRDVGFGLCFVGFQATGNEQAVTAFAAFTVLAASVDGWVVWRFGGDQLKGKAWGHWIGGLLAVAWTAARLWTS